MNTWRNGFLLIGVVFVAGVAATATVEVDGGVVSGSVTEGGIHFFWGVPYAAPPVGELRWRPPQPVAPWDGVREAMSYSDSCSQTLPEVTGFPDIFGTSDAPGMSEDCLYLNVWAPTEDPEARLPVMFWIHGGGNTMGSSASSMFDGAGLARQGVVVVTINYRLNVFGFFAHPGLSAESEHGVSGNYGLLDQIAALEWVQRNIASFGGDPDNVTIFARGPIPKTVAELRTTLDKEYSGYTDRMLAMLGAEDDDDVLGAVVQGFSDTWFGVACRFMVRAHERVGLRAFLYRFSRIRPDPFCQNLILAFHGSEQPYIFRTLDGVELEYDEVDLELSKVMSAYWVRFAKTGNPNGPGLPVWPAYSAGSDQYMDLGDEIAQQSGLRTEAFDLLDEIYAEKRAARE